MFYRNNCKAHICASFRFGLRQIELKSVNHLGVELVESIERLDCDDDSVKSHSTKLLFNITPSDYDRPELKREIEDRQFLRSLGDVLGVENHKLSIERV